MSVETVRKVMVQIEAQANGSVPAQFGKVSESARQADIGVTNLRTNTGASMSQVGAAGEKAGQRMGGGFRHGAIELQHMAHGTRLLGTSMIGLLASASLVDERFAKALAVFEILHSVTGLARGARLAFGGMAGAMGGTATATAALGAATASTAASESGATAAATALAASNAAIAASANAAALAEERLNVALLKKGLINLAPQQGISKAEAFIAGGGAIPAAAPAAPAVAGAGMGLAVPILAASALVVGGLAVLVTKSKAAQDALVPLYNRVTGQAQAVALQMATLDLMKARGEEIRAARRLGGGTIEEEERAGKQIAVRAPFVERGRDLAEQMARVQFERQARVAHPETFIEAPGKKMGETFSKIGELFERGQKFGFQDRTAKGGTVAADIAEQNRLIGEQEKEFGRVSARKAQELDAAKKLADRQGGVFAPGTAAESRRGIVAEEENKLAEMQRASRMQQIAAEQSERTARIRELAKDKENREKEIGALTKQLTPILGIPVEMPWGKSKEPKRERLRQLEQERKELQELQEKERLDTRKIPGALGAPVTDEQIKDQHALVNEAQKKATELQQKTKDLQEEINRKKIEELQTLHEMYTEQEKIFRKMEEQGKERERQSKKTIALMDPFEKRTALDISERLKKGGAMSDMDVEFMKAHQEMFGKSLQKEGDRRFGKDREAQQLQKNLIGLGELDVGAEAGKQKEFAAGKRAETLKKLEEGFAELGKDLELGSKLIQDSLAANLKKNNDALASAVAAVFADERKRIAAEITQKIKEERDKVLAEGKKEAGG